MIILLLHQHSVMIQLIHQLVVIMVLHIIHIIDLQVQVLIELLHSNVTKTVNMVENIMKK